MLKKPLSKNTMTELRNRLRGIWQHWQNGLVADTARWTLFAAAFLFAFVFVHEVLELLRQHGYLGDVDGALVRLGLALFASAGLFSLWWREWYRHHKVTSQWHQMNAMLDDIQRSQKALFALNQRFVEAEEEEEIIAALLEFVPQVVDVAGVSFVPFDERERPMAAISRGRLPQKAMDVWAEHLARPEARQRCQQCKTHHALNNSNCPLSPPATLQELAGVREMHCQRLWCGSHQVGMLTLYRATDAPLDEHQVQLLSTVVDDAALRLDGLRVRRREIEALGQLKAMNERRDMHQVITRFLDNVLHIFDAGFVALLSVQPGTGKQRLYLRGKVTEQVEVFVESILQAAMQTAEAVSIDGIKGTQHGEGGSGALLVTPLYVSNAPPAGALAVGRYPPGEFTRRHMELLQVIAGQLALLLQNAHLMSELEYRLVREERSRLAREIHDGLAQTLGFLKLQAVQMRSYLQRGNLEKLESSLELWYQTVSDAYLDVREAIDGLRLTSSEGQMLSWMTQTLDEFQEHAKIPVIAENLELLEAFSPEVQAQLLRIIQESLTNVRKHAHASRAWVSARRVGHDEVLLEIRDDGRGFSPEDVVPSVRHGLEGMRERTDILGGEFQIISQEGKGTCIQVRLPFLEERHA